MPGYGYAKVSREEQQRWLKVMNDYLLNRDQTVLRRSYLLIDSRHGLKPSDVDMMVLLNRSFIPYQLIFTKSDLVKESDLVGNLKSAFGIMRQMKNASCLPLIHAQISLSQTAPATSTGEAVKPTTALTNVSPVKHANIENRILIRLANMLPTETDSPANDRSPSPPPHQHGNNHTEPAHQSHHHQHHSHGNNSHFSKLPESRNMLLRLNHDLDEMMTDIRNWGLELDRFNFGDMQSDGVRSKDYAAGPSMDNNPLVFDQVIAELSGQASKKVVRLKKMYRNQMQKLKKQYDKHVAELKVQADTLSSRLFASQLRGDNFSDALNTPGGENTASTAAGENDSLQQHQRIVKALREEQDSMQEVLLQRLENERKMSLDKFVQLDGQLKETQRELADAKAQIAQLSSQLLERQNTQLDKDRHAVMDLTEQLKELIKVSQATVPTK
eukprot:gene3954-2813_t